MSTKKPTLADVDGRTPGRAALLQIDLENPGTETGGPMWSDFTEGEHGCTSPYDSCEVLWASVKDDWPTHTHAIVGNDRAKYLVWARRMKAIGIANHSPQDYLDLSR
jgi:hypothetical protein